MNKVWGAESGDEVEENSTPGRDEKEVELIEEEEVGVVGRVVG